ncbi:unnamed protein product [Protopolystoma xenopodis]|uniref:Uncharacterized protein n=1 Tax=Protopolystoma xenopodis TaxID=117903 RepID=A0A448WGH4_9PLAT|nr:unnamed protein product [Protopolystoma xenopodis]
MKWFMLSQEWRRKVKQISPQTADQESLEEGVITPQLNNNNHCEPSGATETTAKQVFRKPDDIAAARETEIHLPRRKWAAGGVETREPAASRWRLWPTWLPGAIQARHLPSNLSLTRILRRLESTSLVEPSLSPQHLSPKQHPRQETVSVEASELDESATIVSAANASRRHWRWRWRPRKKRPSFLELCAQLAELDQTEGDGCANSRWRKSLLWAKISQFRRGIPDLATSPSSAEPHSPHSQPVVLPFQRVNSIFRRTQRSGNETQNNVSSADEEARTGDVWRRKFTETELHSKSEGASEASSDEEMRKAVSEVILFREMPAEQRKPDGEMSRKETKPIATARLLQSDGVAYLDKALEQCDKMLKHSVALDRNGLSEKLRLNQIKSGFGRPSKAELVNFASSLAPKSLETCRTQEVASLHTIHTKVRSRHSDFDTNMTFSDCLQGFREASCEAKKYDQSQESETVLTFAKPDTTPTEDHVAVDSGGELPTSRELLSMDGRIHEFSSNHMDLEKNDPAQAFAKFERAKSTRKLHGDMLDYGRYSIWSHGKIKHVKPASKVSGTQMDDIYLTNAKYEEILDRLTQPHGDPAFKQLPASGVSRLRQRHHDNKGDGSRLNLPGGKVISTRPYRTRKRLLSMLNQNASNSKLWRPLELEETGVSVVNAISQPPYTHTPIRHRKPQVPHHRRRNESDFV